MQIPQYQNVKNNICKKLHEKIHWRQYFILPTLVGFMEGRGVEILIPYINSNIRGKIHVLSSGAAGKIR